MDLTAVIEELERAGGPADAPPSSDPFGLVVWEVCAYLVDDERRAAVFRRLVEHVGVTPEALLTVDLDTLAALLEGGGMHPARRAVRLREAAEIADDLAPDGDLHAVARQALAQAVKAFRRFPSHGRPGAEKVLLLSRAHAVLALESNGLRVLLRLRVAQEQRNYDPRRLTECNRWRWAASRRRPPGLSSSLARFRPSIRRTRPRQWWPKCSSTRMRRCGP
jgi:endonuclease III